MSEKQYFRDIEEGDAVFEGRSSNGITTKTDGSVLVYTGANSQNSKGTVNIDGNNSTIMAIITADKSIDFPEGNNNKETKSSSPDPNKITQTNVKTKFDGKLISNMGKIDYAVPLHISLLLDMVSYTEGTAGHGQNGYDIMFGYHVIKGWTPDTNQLHPNICWPFGKGNCSTAAGRYQFLYSTWVGTMGANTSFSKKNQDLGGIKLVLKRTTNDIALKSYNIAQSGVTDVSKNDSFLKILGTGKSNFAGEWASIPDRTGKYQYAGQSGKLTPQTIYDLYLTILQAYNKSTQQQATQQQATQQQVVQQQVAEPTNIKTDNNATVIQESEPSSPAPLIIEGVDNEDFLFLSETGIELDPVQIFEYTIGEELSVTNVTQKDLYEEPSTEEYKGPTVTVKKIPVKTSVTTTSTQTKTSQSITAPTFTKGKLVLASGVLKGTNGDVNQEIHLPNPTPRGRKTGKELPDKYRGKIPVKEAQYSSKLVSIQDMIKLFKANNLSEQEARYMLTLTAGEAGREDKSKPYFSGYNFNIFGIQAEGYWTAEYNGVKMSSYIKYRYIAQDQYGLRIFAGFDSLKDAVSAKLIACRKKGILTAPSVEKFVELYITTWVAIDFNDENRKEKTAIYNTWGVKFFDKYKAGIY